MKVFLLKFKVNQTMQNKTYTAITIGPIIDTLSSARKTRELWGASYIFSYIIKKIVQRLKANGIQPLLPYYLNDSEWENQHGAGLFPDRIFVEGDPDIEKDYYKPVLEDLSYNISAWLNKRFSAKKTEPKEIKDYLDDYFRFIQINFDCRPSENIIETGTTILDSKELQTKIIPEDLFVGEENPLLLFLYNINDSFLFKDGFGENGITRFPSLIEIATREFKANEPSNYVAFEKEIEIAHERFTNLKSKKNSERTEEDILTKINSLFSKKLNQSHKYIAIVQADGDRIGQIVARVGKNPDEIRNFSRQLMSFSKASTDIVVKYGGSPVYMGGDDLFFFAPLVYMNGSKKVHVLDMVDELNDVFDGIIISYAKNTLIIPENELPSLSFGISLSFYKFPLYEAKQMAFKALFEEIKWADKRNAINLRFRKHSGQIMELFVDKKRTDLWKSTIRFISDNLDQDAKFLSSFAHKLRFQEDVLFDKIAADPYKLEHFFKNNFNENYNSHQAYYILLQDFILKIYSILNKADRPKYLYSVLRFIHFLRS